VRSLTPEEAELWAKVAATIRPLSREPRQADSLNQQGGSAPAKARTQSSLRSSGSKAPLVSGLRPQQEDNFSARTLDSSWDRRLRSGAVEPDRVLDLHGRNLDQAWRAIDGALESAIAAGERVILLITGHCRPGEPPVARGRIRSAVFDWLAASPHARNIAAVRPAHRRHGGGGSLYIILRRSPS
jgi:DNA-nicking Smr family endonuclease